MKNKNIELTKEDFEDLIKYIYELTILESEIESMEHLRLIRVLTNRIVFRETVFYNTDMLEKVLEEIKIQKDEKIIKSIIE